MLINFENSPISCEVFAEVAEFKKFVKDFLPRTELYSQQKRHAFVRKSEELKAFFLVMGYH